MGLFQYYSVFFYTGTVIKDSLWIIADQLIFLCDVIVKSSLFLSCFFFSFYFKICSIK